MANYWLGIIFSYLIVWSNLVNPQIQSGAFCSRGAQKAIVKSGLSDGKSLQFLKSLGSDVMRKVMESNAGQDSIMNPSFWLEVYDSAPSVLQKSFSRLVQDVSLMRPSKDRFNGAFIKQILGQEFSSALDEFDLDQMSQLALDSFQRAQLDQNRQPLYDAFAQLSKLQSRQSIFNNRQPQLWKRGFENSKYNAPQGLRGRMAMEIFHDDYSNYSPDPVLNLVLQYLPYIVGAIFILIGIVLSVISFAYNPVYSRQFRNAIACLTTAAGFFASAISLFTGIGFILSTIILGSFLTLAGIMYVAMTKCETLVQRGINTAVTRFPLEIPSLPQVEMQQQQSQQQQQQQRHTQLSVVNEAAQDAQELQQSQQ
ncbi:hypothetical protein MP228_007607 [Amoeboaphelidium protococcarum]|nr:hypothetical protein MP228_007607 [Amoeboaphelidium protococcarum]